MTLVYPSSAALASPALRSCLFHLLVSSLVLPLLSGFLVHFRTASSVWAVDVLVASVAHLFLALTYPYANAPVHITHHAYPAKLTGLDVLGVKARTIAAALTLAVALAETLNFHAETSSIGGRVRARYEKEKEKRHIIREDRLLEG